MTPLDQSLKEAKLRWADKNRLRHVNVARDTRLAGQVLKRRTGALARSVTSISRVLGSQDGFQFGTNLGYGIAWEEGFHRKAFRIRPKTASALRFTMNGKTIFAKSALIPAKTFAARPFLKPTWEELEEYRRQTAEQDVFDVLRVSIPDRTIHILQ